jgi:hypothetical protein
MNKQLREFLLRVAGENGKISERRLEQWLTKISGRVVDGRCLVREVSADDQADKGRLIQVGSGGFVGCFPYPVGKCQ